MLTVLRLRAEGTASLCETSTLRDQTALKAFAVVFEGLELAAAVVLLFQKTKCREDVVGQRSTIGFAQSVAFPGLCGSQSLVHFLEAID